MVYLAKLPAVPEEGIPADRFGLKPGVLWLGSMLKRCFPEAFKHAKESEEHTL